MPRHASERNDGSPLQRDGPVTENSENCSGKNVRAARGADMTMDAATSECSGRERTSRCARTGVRTTRRAVLQSKADERGGLVQNPIWNRGLPQNRAASCQRAAVSHDVPIR